MSGFIAGVPVPGPAPSGQISSDPFWPTIDLEDLRKTLRLEATVTPQRLETAVVAAIGSVNDDLEVWRQAKEALGFTTLADVPSQKILSLSRLVHLYLRAVSSATGAEVCERYRGYDTTASGVKNGDESDPTIDDYRRDQRWAIRDLLGKSRTTVELL